jgi:hypothetical protein
LAMMWSKRDSPCAEPRLKHYQKGPSGLLQNPPRLPCKQVLRRASRGLPQEGASLNVPGEEGSRAPPPHRHPLQD